jgi:hypothetical protein
MSLLDWLGISEWRARDPEAEVVHRISQQLDSMDPAEARHLSLFAFLLARVAHADLAVEPSAAATANRHWRSPSFCSLVAASRNSRMATKLWVGPSILWVARAISTTMAACEGER